MYKFLLSATACFLAIGSWYDSDFYAYGVLTLLAAIAFFFWRLAEKRRKERLDLIRFHMPELARKRRQLCFDAGYGVTDVSKWRKEMKVFIRNVLHMPTTGKEAQPALDAMMTQIDALVLEHLDRTEDEAAGYSPHMSGTEYERFCTDLLKKNGFETVLTAGSGDQGADIIASRNGRRLAIQCKHYSGSVGNAAIQEVLAARTFYDTDYAAVVSNARYTASARQLARKAGVRLLHHEELTTWSDVH